MAKFANVSGDQRVDLGDIQQIAVDTPLDMQTDLVHGFLIPTGTPSIVSGFRPSLSGGVISINVNADGTPQEGSAFLGYRDAAGAVRYGVVRSHDNTVGSINVGSYVAGDYTVYIRFNLSPGVLQNRPFFSAANNGFEYSKVTPTQLVSSWEARAELNAIMLGPEWLPIATLTVTASTQTLTDTRRMYFEGNAATNFAPFWGTGAADRLTSRSTPISDLRTMIDALKQCLVDIKGPSIAPWYNPVVSGMNIGNRFVPANYPTTAVPNPTDGRIALGDASFYLQGPTATVNKPILAFNGATGAALVMSYDRTTNALLFGSASADAFGVNGLTGYMGMGRYQNAPRHRLHIGALNGGNILQIEGAFGQIASMGLYAYGDQNPAYMYFGGNAGASTVTDPPNYFRIGSTSGNLFELQSAGGASLFNYNLSSGVFNVNGTVAAAKAVITETSFGDGVIVGAYAFIPQGNPGTSFTNPGFGIAQAVWSSNGVCVVTLTKTTPNAIVMTNIWDLTDYCQSSAATPIDSDGKTFRVKTSRMKPPSDDPNDLPTDEPHISNANIGFAVCVLKVG